MSKEYHIDNEPADFQDIVKMAKQEGYESSSGIYQSSVCANYLRKNGHTVGYAKDIQVTSK